jgi:Family of unknown function (DUF6152)
MRFWSVALILAMALPLGAHHSFTQYYDASKQEVLTGVIVELQMINPHVVLIVDVSGPGGRKGRWAFEGYAPNAFSRGGLDIKRKFQPGKQITISGWPAKDPAARVFSGREVTFPDKSTVLFGPTPEEGDRWRCIPENPCPYKYPEVPSR